jgi:excisionase family DNA binding protein
MNDAVLSTHNIAKILNVDISSVSNWIDSGKLRAYRTPGGHRRVKREDFMHFIKEYNMPIKTRVEDGCKILIVDDEESIRASIRKIIEKKFPSVEIFEAGDGFSAGKILGIEKVDILLLDINMPGMNGIDVMYSIKEDPRLGNPEIIVITGCGEQGLEKKVIELGARRLIAKPFEKSELEDVLKETINI